MSYRIEVAPEFARRLKKLSKRYKSIKQDYGDFLHSLQSNPLQGVDLGKGLRKIRMSIASKGKGKSGYYIINSHVKRHHGGSMKLWFERLKIINLPRELVIYQC